MRQKKKVKEDELAPVPHQRSIKGFTILEVLVSMTILTVTLIAIFQTFSISIFTLTTTDNLWKSISHSQNELLRWERNPKPPPLSSLEGGFENEENSLFGFRWKRDVEDIMPLPGILVRRVRYQLLWQEGQNKHTYDAELYVNPN